MAECFGEYVQGVLRARVHRNTISRLLTQQDPPARSTVIALAGAMGLSPEALDAEYETYRIRRGADEARPSPRERLDLQIPSEVAALMRAVDAESQRFGMPAGEASARVVTVGIALLMGMPDPVRNALLGWCERAERVAGEVRPEVAVKVHQMAAKVCEAEAAHYDLAHHDSPTVRYTMERVIAPLVREHLGGEDPRAA